MKKCSCCQNIQSEINYHKNKRNTDRLASECKKCVKKVGERYHKTLPGLYSRIYKGMLTSSKKRKHPLPTFTKAELIVWAEHKNMKQLFEIFVNNNYVQELKPSVDRLNDALPYTFKNLQLITWQENNEKNKLQRKNWKTTKQTKEVLMLDKKTNSLLARFFNIRYASRITGINQSNITKVCKGKAITAGGYKWSYVV